MDRLQLEHALRAAQEITGEKEFVVIGSCSVLGWNPNAGKSLTRFTEEIDLYPRYRPELSQQLNAIGEASAFRSAFGFYVDPVGPETAILPPGWETRLAKVCNENTNHATGWCVDVNDVAVAKLIAGRPKDRDFVEELFVNKLASIEIIRERLSTIQGPHRQIMDMAADYLDQAFTDAEAAIKRAQLKGKTPPFGRDFGPED